MKKLFTSILLSFTLFSSNAFAVTTILPGESAEVQNYTTDECISKLDEINNIYGDQDALESYINEHGQDYVAEVVLGCAIKTGRIKMWMLPYFISRILSFIVGISGLISVLMIIIGAFYYIAGGLNEDKEKGKTIITYALGGFVLVMLAWVIVNALLLLLTT